MDQITRRRIIHHNLCASWDGSGARSMNLPDHSGLAQHQFTAACDDVPSAGTLVISIRPIGSGFFAPIGSIDLSVSGSGTLLVPALFDGVSLSFSPALASSTVTVEVASTGTEFYQSTGQKDDTSRRRVTSSAINYWNSADPVTVNAQAHSGLSQHQVALAGGSGTVRLLGRSIGGTVFASINSDTESLQAVGDVAIFSGLYDAFLMKASASGTVNGQIDSIGESLFFA